MVVALLSALLSLGAVVDVRHAPLLSYMAVRGAQIGPVELGKSVSGAGYGAFVTEDVEEDEVLFTIPKLACIGLYTACGDEEVGTSLARLAAAGGNGGATVALAGFLAKEWLCHGTEGEYGPYLAMLPWDAEWPPEGEQEQEHVLWWSESQIDSLEGSDAFEDALGLREEVALACKVCKGLIGKAVREGYKASGKNLWDIWTADDDIDRAVRGAFVSILSRAFAQGSEGGEEGGEAEGEDPAATRRLVPLLDMLQHAADPNVRYGSTPDGDGSVVVKAKRALKAGEELVNCYDYGDSLSEGQFLSRFGFVPGQAVGDFVSTIQSPGPFYSPESYGVGGG